MLNESRWKRSKWESMQETLEMARTSIGNAVGGVVQLWALSLSTAWQCLCRWAESDKTSTARFLLLLCSDVAKPLTEWKKEIKNPDTDLLMRSMLLKECPHGVVKASELIYTANKMWHRWWWLYELRNCKHKTYKKQCHLTEQSWAVCVWVDRTLWWWFIVTVDAKGGCLSPMSLFLLVRHRLLDDYRPLTCCEWLPFSSRHLSLSST